MPLPKKPAPREGFCDPTSPSLEKMMKLGMSVTWNGITQVINNNVKRKLRPLNFTTAKTKAAMEQVSNCPSVFNVASSKLLKICRGNSGSFLNRSVKFTSVAGFGIKVRVY